LAKLSRARKHSIAERFRDYVDVSLCRFDIVVSATRTLNREY